MAVICRKPQPEYYSVAFHGSKHFHRCCYFIGKTRYKDVQRQCNRIHTVLLVFQLVLLEETWCDLFLLTLAQWQVDFTELDDNSNTTSRSGNAAMASLDNEENPKDVLRRIRNLVSRLSEVSPDTTEFACLKAVALFRTDAASRLYNPALVEHLQDQAQMLLLEYAHQQVPRHAARFGRLLLSLAALRTVSARALQRAFFLQTVGSANLERVIKDIFNGVSSPKKAVRLFVTLLY